MMNDPSEQILQCETPGCSNKFRRKHGFSFAVAYVCPGLDINEDGSVTMYPGHVCEESGGTAQHWHCSHEHAVTGAHACVDHIAARTDKHSQVSTLHQE